MSNFVYDKYIGGLHRGEIGDLRTANGVDLRAVFCRVAAGYYQPDKAADTFLSAINSEHRSGLSDPLVSTVVDEYKIDVDDFLFPADSLADPGFDYNALVYLIWTGNQATSRLISLKDTGIAQLPFRASGVIVSVEVDSADGIYKFAA